MAEGDTQKMCLAFMAAGKNSKVFIFSFREAKLLL